MKSKRILFVCSGNIFRSMTAEYALKKFLADNRITDWNVSSAGTTARKQTARPALLEALETKGVEVSDHTQTKLTEKLLEASDVIVAMAQEHVNFIIERFGSFPVFLFNDLAYKEKSSVFDVEDIVSDHEVNKTAVDEMIKRTVEYIFEAIPSLFTNISQEYVKETENKN